MSVLIRKIISITVACMGMEGNGKVEEDAGEMVGGLLFHTMLPTW